MQKETERLRRKFHEGRLELFNHVHWDSSCQDLLETHSAFIDGLIKEIHEIACRAADREAVRSEHSGLAIVATGGYGRRELNPYSDIDMALIPSEEEDPWVEALVHTIFKLIMDVFLSLRDVHVGYAFRPIADASAWDIKTKTALLDSRHICGDSALVKKLELRIREGLLPLDLALETQFSTNSNKRTQNSFYSVEPDLKNGPGSLRDLHRARWIFKLLLGLDGRALDQALINRAIVSERQIAEIHTAAVWFWRARTWLHLTAKKLSDVLITNYQDRIAKELSDCSSQEWLSQHYAHSELLAGFYEIAVRALLKGPLMVHGVLLENGFLHRHSDSLNRVSAANMFLVAQRYSIPVSFDDQNLLERARNNAIETRKPSDEEIWAFNQALGESRGVAVFLRALSKFGILDRFIPDYSKVMRFAPPDPAHQYTVGEHSMRMVEHLERLRSGMDSEEQKFSELLGQCAHFDMLCLASLLHDAGKLLPGSDHCETGAELAKSVAARLNLPFEKREILDILVRRHLSLVRTARFQDLKSAHVIRKVAEQAFSIEALRHLYVFTYVDNKAVAENNWTTMDLRDLEDLYRRIQDYFKNQSDEASDFNTEENRSLLIRQKLTALQSKNETAVLKYCDAMPAGYVLNTPLAEIAFHLELLDRLESEGVVLDVYNQPGEDYSELTICAFDDPMPGMLAKITGALYGCDADIHKAQAFTIEKKKPVILDTLWIRSNGMQISESKARRIQYALKEVLSGAITIERYLHSVGKTSLRGIALDAIDMRNDLSEEHTVVRIVAHDLQGLLYLMTRCLSRCGLAIHSAKVATWNARAENNFYVTAITGGQIPDANLPAWTDRLLKELRGSRENE